MDTIAADPPEVDEATVSRALANEYGLAGGLQPLVSERDQNFRLDCADGARFVVKIANAREPAEITDFQVQVLRHLEVVECPVPVPRVIPTLSGALTTKIDGQPGSLRVVSYLPGDSAESVGISSALGAGLGRRLAKLDLALHGFSHPGQSQVLMWDMQRAADLKDILEYVPGAELRDQLFDCIGEFERRVMPELPGLRSQVIHNDMNPGNILVDRNDHSVMTGIIDFGDMLKAPLVVDAAIAASYMRDEDFGVMREFFCGYQSVIDFEPGEQRILYDLVRTRLTATLAILSWRTSARAADDPYLEKVWAESSAERFFGQITALGRERFDREVLGK